MLLLFRNNADTNHAPCLEFLSQHLLARISRRYRSPHPGNELTSLLIVLLDSIPKTLAQCRRTWEAVRDENSTRPDAECLKLPEGKVFRTISTEARPGRTFLRPLS